MTEHHEERDQLPIDLLAELPTVEHADGFWIDLDRRLADEPRSGSGDAATTAAVALRPDPPSSNGRHRLPGETTKLPRPTSLTMLLAGNMRLTSRPTGPTESRWRLVGVPSRLTEASWPSSRWN